MRINDRIKERRKDLGLSADDVAAALGVSRATVFRYESRDIEKIPVSMLIPLAKVLKCSPAYLIGWEENTQLDKKVVVNDREYNFLNNYRNADKSTKETVDRLLFYSSSISKLMEGKEDGNT